MKEYKQKFFPKIYNQRVLPVFSFVKKHRKVFLGILILGSSLVMGKRVVKADDLPFSADFDERNKDEILKSIEDPHQKDIANFAITSKDIALQAVNLGAGAACFGYCYFFLSELGDHTASGICYVFCAAFMGITTYTAFRRVWQSYSIPAKNYLLRLSFSIFNTEK